jgi:hypothetical protein
MAVFCTVASWSLLENDRRFRGDLIALMMAAVSTSETSVNFYQTTRHNKPQDSQQQFNKLK